MPDVIERPLGIVYMFDDERVVLLSIWGFLNALLSAFPSNSVFSPLPAFSVPRTSSGVV